MTIEEYRETYAGLSSSAVRGLIKTDVSFRETTEALYEQWFRERLNKTCSSCWFDAYILLMKFSKDAQTVKLARRFELKNGAMLRSNDSRKLATKANLTDALALYHLAYNAGNIVKFSRYPENWERLVAQYKLVQINTETPADGVSQVDGTSTSTQDEMPAEAKETAPIEGSESVVTVAETSTPTSTEELTPTEEKAAEEAKMEAAAEAAAVAVSEEETDAAQKAVKKASAALKVAEAKLVNALKGGDTDKVTKAKASVDKCRKTLKKAEEALAALTGQTK
ncbi:MAG: hypothetical protein LUE27_00945 [Clostridia bacterium]|nr:hypothetical protein [Clostridia bacterium]